MIGAIDVEGREIPYLALDRLFRTTIIVASVEGAILRFFAIWLRCGARYAIHE